MIKRILNYIRKKAFFEGVRLVLALFCCLAKAQAKNESGAIVKNCLQQSINGKKYVNKDRKRAKSVTLLYRGKNPIIQTIRNK